MSNVIQWADAVNALKVIADEQQLVAGMSVAEASVALKYTMGSSGMYLKTVMSTIAPSVVGATATEVVATGTASATAVTTAVNLTLVEGAGGVASVAGIGSIALPIAGCIAAAGGGYLIGKELNKNEVYSEFMDGLLFPAFDFLTGQNIAGELYDELNAPTVPMLYDVNGDTYLPSGMFTGIKNFLDLSSSTTGNLLLNADVILPQAYNAIVGPFVAGSDILYFLLSSITPFKIITQYEPNYHYYYDLITNDTMSVTRWTSTNEGPWISISTQPGLSNGDRPSITNYIVYSNDTILFGESPVATDNWSHIDLPTGITKYTPAISSITPLIDPSGSSWTHVFLPSTSPLEMPDGEAVPEVAPVFNPGTLTPYIAPFQPQPADVPLRIPVNAPVNPLVIIPNPEPNTSNDPYPEPNPANDPSQLAEPVPVSEPVEPIPEPVSSGVPIVPIVPPVIAPSSAKGLLHVYNPTPLQVDQFGEWLWTTFSGDIIDTISKLFNNPMDAVIGLHELYATPITSTSTTIKAGYLDSGVASQLVSSRYIEIKCGALSVPEYWGNYLDYAPYTKSYCYLPFIGIVELNTDDIVGSGVEITYRIDVYNGSCIALITTAKLGSSESITYQFSGSCSVEVPITSGMKTAVQNALMGAATTAIAAATGGAGLVGAAMIGGVRGANSKNLVQHSGAFGSSFGAMGVKIPFLIIKRPKQKVVYGYNENYGYPSHKMVLISTCSGYLKAIEVDVVSPTATEAEKKMIEELLKSGIFVN